MTMGERIRSLRKEHDLTQEELGKHLGIGKSAVLKYENGEVSDIPTSKIKKMAEMFGVSPTYLMCFDQYNEEDLAEETKLIEAVQAKWGKDAVTLLETYSNLNPDGRSRMLAYLEDFNQIMKYTKVQGGSR